MWTAAGPLKLVLLAGVLLPSVEAVTEPSTNVEEATAAALAPVCNAVDAVEGASCQMVMLQQKVSKERTPALTAVFLSSGRDPVSMTSTDRATGLSSSQHRSQYQTGNTAALDEAGYRSVLELRSQTQTETLVRRLVQELGLKVMNEENFRGYVGSLSETGVDLSTIRGNLEGEAGQPCGWLTKSHKPYLDGITGSTAALTEDGYRQVAELRSIFEMFRFASRVISNEGYYLVDKGALDGMLAYYTCDKGIQSYGNMLNEVRRVVGSDNAWLSLQPPANLIDVSKQLERQGEKVSAIPASFISTSGTHSSVRKRDEKLEERIRSWSPKGLGTTAMLNEDGYKQAAEMKSNTEMSIFVLRTIRQMGLQVVDENTFAGFVPFYSGEAGTQSFASLKAEIHKLQGEVCSWIVPANDNRSKAISGNLTSMTEEGYAAVAKMRSPSDTHDFLHRVFSDMHMEVIDKNGLNGFIPFHDCERGANSLATLRKEVIDAAQAQVWIRAMDSASILQQERDSLKSSDNSSSAGKHDAKASDGDIVETKTEGASKKSEGASQRTPAYLTDSKVVVETVEFSKFNGTDTTQESDSGNEEAGNQAASAEEAGKAAASGEERLSRTDVAEEKAASGKESGSTDKDAAGNNESETSHSSKASRGANGKVEKNTSGESGKVAEVASNNDEHGYEEQDDLDDGEDDLADDADDHVVDEDGKVSKIKSATGEKKEVVSNSANDRSDDEDDIDDHHDDQVFDDDGKVSEVKSAEGEKKEVVSNSADDEDDLDDDHDDQVVDDDGKVNKVKSAEGEKKEVVSNSADDGADDDDEDDVDDDDDHVGDDDGEVSKVKSAKGEKEEVASNSADDGEDDEDEDDVDDDDHVGDDDGKVSKGKSAKGEKKEVVSSQYSDEPKNEDESLISTWTKAQTRSKELGVALGQKKALVESETSSKDQEKIKFKGALHVAF